MRWPIVAVLFVVAMFTFFVCYAVSSLLLDTVSDALLPVASSEADAIITLLSTAFGVISAVFVTIIIVLYGVESLSDEPEYFWRQ